MRFLSKDPLLAHRTMFWAKCSGFSPLKPCKIPIHFPSEDLPGWPPRRASAIPGGGPGNRPAADLRCVRDHVRVNALTGSLTAPDWRFFIIYLCKLSFDLDCCDLLAPSPSAYFGPTAFYVSYPAINCGRGSVKLTVVHSEVHLAEQKN